MLTASNSKRLRDAFGMEVPWADLIARVGSHRLLRQFRAAPHGGPAPPSIGIGDCECPPAGVSRTCILTVHTVARCQLQKHQRPSDRSQRTWAIGSFGPSLQYILYNGGHHLGNPGTWHACCHSGNTLAVMCCLRAFGTVPYNAVRHRPPVHRVRGRAAALRDAVDTFPPVRHPAITPKPPSHSC
jgi:hypothetical protein